MQRVLTVAAEGRTYADWHQAVVEPNARPRHDFAVRDRSPYYPERLARARRGAVAPASV